MISPSALATPGTLRAWRAVRRVAVAALRVVSLTSSPASRTASAAPVRVTSYDGLPFTSACTTASVSFGISFSTRSSIFSSSARIEAASLAVLSSPTDCASRSMAM